MAKTLGADGKAVEGGAPLDATKEHNVGARKEQLKKADAEISATERQVEAKRAEIKALNKTIANTYRKVKSDLGINRVNFEVVRGILALEDDARGETEDQIRECYEALRPGEQLDWLNATSAAAPPTPPETSEAPKLH